MPPASWSPRSASRGRRSRSSGALALPVTTLILLTWGTFAFGAVYPWAYVPLAAGCALVGVLGLSVGDRPLWAHNRVLLAALAGIATIGLLQLVPLPRTLLAVVSPGTSAFLDRFDLAWSHAIDPSTGEQLDLRHPVSLAPEMTRRALLLMASFALLLVGLLRSLSRTAAARLAVGIVCVGGALAVFGIAQKAMLGDNAFEGMRIYGVWKPADILSTPFGPYVNKNHFAGWMLMAIPLALGLAAAQYKSRVNPPSTLRSLLVWLSEPDGGRMLLYLVVATIMSLSVLMTGSRSGIGCLALLLIGLAAGIGRQSSVRVRLAAAATVVVLLAAALQWAGRDAKLERFVSDNESISMRLNIWSMSARALPSFPVVGSGLDTFGKVSMAHQPPGQDLHYNEAHNDYVQLLVEGGVVTGVLLLLALGGIAASAAARLRSQDDGVELHWIRVGSVAALCTIGMQALVEFSLQMPGNAALFVVLLALALFTPAAHRSTH